MGQGNNASGVFHAQGGDLNTWPARNTFVSNSVVTGVASLATATAYSETVGNINIHNSARTSAGENHIVIPRMIQLTALAVNTGANLSYLHFYIDNATRWSSGGTELTPNTTSFDEASEFSDFTPKATVHVGDLTLSAATEDEKKIKTVQANIVIMAIGDVINIWFGAGPGSDAIGEEVSNIIVPPVFLGRNQNLSIHWSAASQSDDPLFIYHIHHEEVGHRRN